MNRRKLILVAAGVLTATALFGQDYSVDSHGYATFEHQGFTFKINASAIGTDAGTQAVQCMKSNLDDIVSFVPQDALNVMRKRTIWMEENNTHNRSAAWYHRNASYPPSIGDLVEKGKCLEITNYQRYYETVARNQPLMVFHELSHLYHDQGLGGNSNKEIIAAYNNAKEKGLYAKGIRRMMTGDRKSKWVKNGQPAYCMNDPWEYFAELSEAYWGENDYYPFNYEQLKKHDPVGFDLMMKIWGPRPDKQ